MTTVADPKDLTYPFFNPAAVEGFKRLKALVIVELQLRILLLRMNKVHTDVPHRDKGKIFWTCLAIGFVNFVRTNSANRFYLLLVPFGGFAIQLSTNTSFRLCHHNHRGQIITYKR